jgi:hypothetical protein
VFGEAPATFLVISITSNTAWLATGRGYAYSHLVVGENTRNGGECVNVFFVPLPDT